MVDLSSAPRVTSSTQAESSASFDRFTYPVRYYFVNYSAACRIPAESISSTSPLPTRDSPFQKDIRECGTLLEQLLLDVSHPLRLSSTHQFTSNSTGTPNSSKIQVAYQRNGAGQFYSGQLTPPFRSVMSFARRQSFRVQSTSSTPSYARTSPYIVILPPNVTKIGKGVFSLIICFPFLPLFTYVATIQS